MFLHFGPFSVAAESGLFLFFQAFVRNAVVSVRAVLTTHLITSFI
jgi:hypothetical protein